MAEQDAATVDDSEIPAFSELESDAEEGLRRFGVYKQGLGLGFNLGFGLRGWGCGLWDWGHTAGKARPF